MEVHETGPHHNHTLTRTRTPNISAQVVINGPMTCSILPTLQRRRRRRREHSVRFLRLQPTMRSYNPATTRRQSWLFTSHLHQLALPGHKRSGGMPLIQPHRIRPLQVYNLHKARPGHLMHHKAALMFIGIVLCEVNPSLHRLSA